LFNGVRAGAEPGAEPASRDALDALTCSLTTVALIHACSYGLFKATDKKLLSSDNLADRLSTVEKINKE
jgi:hypothetical protein